MANDIQNWQEIARSFLHKVQEGRTVEPELAVLAALPAAGLKSVLNHDDKRKAFWINLYNAFTRHLLRPDSPLDDRGFRKRHFQSRKLLVAGRLLSFDDIEHGILRRSQYKYGLGYFTHPFPSAFEREARLQKRDYRIHFALNCGGHSCPAIRDYDADRIEAQLDLAMQAFLGSETEYKVERGEVSTSAILSWFRGDFGGKKGILRLLKQQKLIPSDASPKLTFKPYIWKKPV